MLPNLASALLSWGSLVEMQIVRTTAVDFEPQTEVLNILTVSMTLQAMRPRDVVRKPENERRWKWWTGWSTAKLTADTVLQDPDGLQFRVQSVEDWSQSGFYKYELTEQPVGLP
jgi:hypothetical protein